MAEPRKVQFVTLSAFAAGPATESRKRRLDDEADKNFDGDVGIGKSVTGAGGGGGLFGKTGDRDSEPNRATVRLNLSLTEPNDQSSAEFNYSELIQSLQKKPQNSKPALDPNDPFNDDERERQEVEALAKKFENKYANTGKKKRKERMQDLIDIGFGYDESDPFIDNSEAYDELVPASLTTKLGGFYINTGTLQFRAASESEGEDESKVATTQAGGDAQMIKKRKRKDGTILEEKKPRKNRVPKQGVTALSLHRPEKKKRKKLMKDSLYLAAMLRRFTREKEELRRKNPQVVPPHLVMAAANVPSHTNHLLHNSGLPANSVATTTGNNDISLADLTADPAMMSLLSSANESELQDLLGDLDFSMLDPGPLTSSPARENGLMGVGASPGQKAGQAGRGGGGAQAGMGMGMGAGVGVGGRLLSPPPLPGGLPGPLIKRIEDLRAASRQFDQEGRKKFFTLDMNNILLDIELQVQEQPVEVRSSIYSHMEAFVPCNKEALLKRLKKLSLNIQDDRLRAPLLKLKLAVCSVMPEQIARYNMDCMAKAAAKQQSEEGEKNGSEEEDEEKPGKRVMGPRKKFLWDDKLRTLLCGLVRVKLSCYEQEPQGSLSVEDYLKAFMENEVKPLWPKGWMQARMLFKESRIVHGHLTGLGKKRMVPGPKAIKAKEGAWIPRPGPVGVVQSPAAPVPVVRRPPASPSEPICLSDSLDEDLATNSLDSISQALALLSNAAKGLTQNNGPSVIASSLAATLASATPPGLSAAHYASALSHSLPGKLDTSVISLANMSTLSTSPSLAASSRPLTVTSSPSAASSRGEAYGMPPAQRHSMTPTHRSGAGLNSPSPPKPRPPPTASPLLPPQQKPFCPPGMKPGQATPPPGQVKSSGSKAAGGIVGGSSGIAGGAQQARANSHPPPQLNPKSPQQTQHRLPGSPSPVPSSPTASKPQPPPQHPHLQSNFITPMQATLTKSSHSSSSPIIKLTPRPPAPTPPPASSPSPSSSSSASTSSSPSSLPHSRPQMVANSHQYGSAKGPGFRPVFTTPGGSTAKSGQVSYSFAGSQKASVSLVGGGGGGGIGNATIPSPVGTPPSSVQQDGSPSPSGMTGGHGGGQRQRAAGQSAKTVTSRAASTSALPSPPASSHLSQVSSAAATNLLGSVPPSLPLGFGMLGGLVPVSLPFQFPPLLNFSPPTAPGTMSSTAATNSGYTALAQNLFKSLQSGTQAALPPHLQLAFSGKLCSSSPTSAHPSPLRRCSLQAH
ncbi:hypothetical protein ACEWY4_018149 [Coilia grayii]|uniref:Ubinuclein-2-like n=1 Tax=Coilia grayii TaxID=363190 RepID=A0ABD1JL36_9TELE